MPSGSLSAIVEQLRTAGMTDGELLTQFLNHHDQDALAALIERHASMVWGVCRRILRNHDDAEDALQATFLVLVRRAEAVVPREMVANWLFGVARQTAVRLRATVAKRSVREAQMDERNEPAAAIESRDEELLSVLDEELGRLPERSRILIVLCDLEGNSRKDVARQLGCPEGTVASRLARARQLLAKRMARRGLAISGGSLATLLSCSVTSAGAPPAVVNSTIEVATSLANGPVVGVISSRVAALTEGVLKTMFLNKLKTVVVVAMVLGLLAAGATALTSRSAAANGRPAAEALVVAPAKPAKEAFTAWGKEVDGVQAGLGYPAGAKQVYAPGETAKLVVRVRNVGKKDVKFVYAWEDFYAQPPIVTDGAGKKVPFTGVIFTGWLVFKEVTLAPGKTTDLCELNVAIHPENKSRPWSLYETGKFQLQFERIGGNIGTGEIKYDPVLSKLVTGKLDLEVKEAADPPAKLEKETFTAWGKEINSLQAGIGFPPGEKRAYSHGETVKLVVRVRNVGKEAVEFKHIWAFFVENPPTVTDPDGKPVQLPKYSAEGLHRPRNPNVEPGKEIDLYEWWFELRPQGEDRKEKTIQGTGKFTVRCERIVGSTSGNREDPNPAMSKLATGKLELEVKAKAPASPDKK